MNAAKQDCPPRLDLAAWASTAATMAAPSSSMHTHVQSCPKCSRYVQELQDARQELLGPDPAWTSRNAARTILATAEARKRSRTGWRWAWPVAALPAAALVGLFVMSGRNVPDNGAEAITAAGSVRTKGSLALAIVSKRGEALFPISDGDEVLAGDRLRFEYTQAQPGFLMVFSVDDQGTVSPYYDDDRLKSVPVTAGSRIALPGSVELDDHKGVERVFALWSPQPLEGGAVQAAVNQALAQAGGNVANVVKLPVQAQQTSVLLRRP